MTFTYTETAAGGMNNGAVRLSFPTTWSAPHTTTTNAAGYTTALAGSVSRVGYLVTVGSLNLDQGESFTITYGDTSQGGPGATAPAAGSSGLETWSALESRAAAASSPQSPAPPPSTSPTPPTAAAP